jgi:hypothetical protein
MSAVIMRVSWNSNYDVALRACLWCALLLAVALVTPLVVAAVAPVVVGCCSAVVGAVPQIAITIAVFYGSWLVKP